VFALFAPLSRISRFRKTLDLRLLDMFGRIGGQALRSAGRRPIARPRLYARNFSAQSGTNATTAASAPSPLAGITSELDRIAPRFEVPATQITIIDSPTSFYSTLKVCLPHCLLPKCA
jgi:CDP-diacylglycerol--glycerol-3-phosphate 3-phosphatidyltransferase